MALVMWMSAGERFRAAHLVRVKEPRKAGEPKPAARARTLCGRQEKADWTPVIPTALAKCVSCDRYAAKHADTVIEPAELD